MKLFPEPLRKKFMSLTLLFYSLICTLFLPASSFAAELAPPPAQAALQEMALHPIELRTAIFKTDNYPIDLETVLKLVETQNLSIAQSRKNSEIFQSRLRQQQVSLLPNITGSYSQNSQSGRQGFISGAQGGFISGVNTTGGGVSPNTGNNRSSNGGGSQTFLQGQLNASWTLYPGGRNIYQILAAKRRKDSADFLLTQTYQEQLSLAAQNYYKLLAAYEEKEVSVRAAENALEQVRINQGKVDVGKGIPLDLSQAKTAYAQQQSSLVQAEAAIFQAEQVLLNSLNLEPTIHLVPNGLDSQQKLLIAETVSVEQLLSKAIANNPTMKSGIQELKALDYDYKIIRSDLVPSVTFQAYARGSGTEFDSLQRSNSNGITVNANLLQNMGLLIPFQMQEKKRLIEQKKLAQQALIRTIQSQVMTAFLSSENYKNAIEASRQALDSAQESYDLAFGRFKAGYGINLDTLTAQTNLATARRNLVQAVLNYNQSQVQLVQALGMISPEAITQGIQWQGQMKNGSSNQ